MLSVLRIVTIYACLQQSFARPGRMKHSMEKRWAYIENGDPQMRTIHTDCKKIVKEYSDGEMPFYEYTAKMKKCMNRQQRTDIPEQEGDYFTPSFDVPATAKRFETPGTQPIQPATNSYGNYGYDYNNQYQFQNPYGSIDQRGNIASPQTPQYEVPQTQSQAQAIPFSNSYYNYVQQNQPGGQLTSRSEIPSYQEPFAQNTMYSSDIVKKDEIPRPNEQ